MKKINSLLCTVLFLVLVSSCYEDLDDNAATPSEISDFVWRGMSTFYVYKDEIPDLANDRFSSEFEYWDYLNSFSSPEDLFADLLYLPDDVDEFSILVPNHIDLEQQLNGTSLNNGMAFGLVQLQSGTIFGYVRYVMPNTSAESEGVQRGMIFNAVDGVELTADNFRSLLFGSSLTYTINLATYNNNGTPETSDDSIIPGTQSITLTKSEYTENPILTHSVINESGTSIGYLMYNGFRSSNANISELNAVFAEFQAANVTDLVLDLRYNPGGSVSTAIWLSSMITGQFTGQTFFNEEWNDQIQMAIENQNPNALSNPFVDEMVKVNTDGDIIFQESINSLGLNKVYILTSSRTASASELVINGLNAYIDVVQIGESTTGKPQASTTLYDSENFLRTDANPSHFYALQPLIYESANADGFSSYYDGLGPTLGFGLSEDYGNLGILGDINEPLLARALQDITGLSRSFSLNSVKEYKVEIADQNFDKPILNEMIDDLNK